MRSMYSFRIWILFAIVFVAIMSVSSCKYRYMEKPERLLTHEEMVDIICEAAYIESLEARGAFIHDSTLARVGKNAFIRSMYRRYGITYEVLKQNNEYYAENSKEYIAIYRDAINRILAEENEYEEGIKHAVQKAEEAARAKIKAMEDSITDSKTRDSIILAREDSIMNLHRVNDKSETNENEIEEFGGGWFVKK